MLGRYTTGAWTLRFRRSELVYLDSNQD
ncbi:protein of unknown function [Streptomyces murinus]